MDGGGVQRSSERRGEWGRDGHRRGSGGRKEGSEGSNVAELRQKNNIKVLKTVLVIYEVRKSI